MAHVFIVGSGRTPGTLAKGWTESIEATLDANRKETRWRTWARWIEQNPKIPSAREWWSWLKQNTAGKVVVREEWVLNATTLSVIFEDENDAFAYRLRWT